MFVDSFFLIKSVGGLAQKNLKKTLPFLCVFLPNKGVGGLAQKNLKKNLCQPPNIYILLTNTR